MTLNLNCIRDTLLAAEALPLNGKLYMTELFEMFPEYTHDDILYTCLKLKEAEFLSVVTKKNGSNILPSFITDITYEGHQFLANIRNPKLWGKIRSTAGEIGINAVNGLSQIALDVIVSCIKSHFSS